MKSQRTCSQKFVKKKHGQLAIVDSFKKKTKKGVSNVEQVDKIENK